MCRISECIASSIISALFLAVASSATASARIPASCIWLEKCCALASDHTRSRTGTCRQRMQSTALFRAHSSSSVAAAMPARRRPSTRSRTRVRANARKPRRTVAAYAATSHSTSDMCMSERK
uniref:Molluscum contagiosum virus type 1 ORF1 and ORF2 DNA n=1 Tax=Molluscum contagiosum virus subtype 1 TaxID=10280 RepID=Q85286_MCV1|nr:ORF1 [Molluscum contagiosum virus subtype 1]